MTLSDAANAVAAEIEAGKLKPGRSALVLGNQPCCALGHVLCRSAADFDPDRVSAVYDVLSRTDLDPLLQDVAAENDCRGPDLAGALRRLATACQERGL